MSQLKLFMAYHKNKNPQLRNVLVEINMGLARKVASRFSLINTESFDDLEQVALLKLISAVEKFDPTRGNQFSTYAVPKIEGAIKQYLRDKGSTVRIPQTMQDLHCKKVKAEARLTTMLGRTPTIDEVAEYLGVSCDRLMSVELSQKNKVAVSLHTILDSSESITLEDTLVASSTPPIELIDVPPIPLFKTENTNSLSTLALVFSSDGTCKHAASTLSTSSATIKRRLRKAVEEFACSGV